MAYSNFCSPFVPVWETDIRLVVIPETYKTLSKYKDCSLSEHEWRSIYSFNPMLTAVKIDAIEQELL